ncbi:two-component regulator propeller domain-containing protein [Flavobacterium sp. UMI-01]|uniref:hybrid sensor histidine kinase/response regulator transcription factor n=1 Tax=Flavobacterium sp. UMI-01 TaxID=1441053 RepID=UPI00207FAA7E|nr:two-component regulator propeller domain-containing protein [Flavobacterium sp. UMI-01]GIZ08784.1 hybrid sensor histidine kinase/response regulator [Flavobacterium sp. UMI-01]
MTHLLFGQFNNLKFENLDTFNGLSSSTCTEIFQDREGFLWFGTIDGLNKYNGYEFEIYRTVLNDSKSISNNRVNAIEEDNEGNLWIGTNNGLNLFNKKTNKFTRINLYPQNIYPQTPSSTTQKIINDLWYDKINNLLWVATNNGAIKIGLSDYTSNVQNYKFSYYVNSQTNRKSIDNNSVNVIVKDKNGDVWVATNGDYLNKYNSTKDNFERVYIKKTKAYELNHLPKRLYVDKDGDFWIGNDLSNLILWNRKTNTFSHISVVGSSTAIFDIYQDKKGLFWVSTDVSGLFLFQKKNGSATLQRHIVNDFLDPFSLPNNKPSKIFEDRKGIYWIGSYDKGVSKLDPSSYSFGHYYYQPNDSNGLNQKTVQSVLQDSKGRIWISAYNGGLNLFDEKTKSFKHIVSRPGGLSSNKILYTFESRDGHIWVCTLDGGVCKFNPDSNSFETFLHNNQNPNSIGQSSVWTGVEDSQRRIWFGLRTEGLSLYHPESKQFTNFRSVNGKENSLASNSVICTFIDSKNRLFIGTSLGLNIVDLNKIKGIPKDIDFVQVKGNGIEGGGVNYVTEDHQNNIWVGSDNGLYKLDSKLNLKKSYSSENGLPNNLVVGIKEDNNYNIWVTTKGGLSFLNPKTNQIMNFNAHDGLQGTEFQSKSIAKTRNGRIIVGGINGFNIFQPNDIKIAKSLALRPQITKFKLNNKVVYQGDSINGRVLLNKSISEIKELVLNYNENYISLEFVALYFDNPDQVHYAYRMKGLDEDFINVGTNRAVNLSNLKSGNYTFEVKATTNGQWETAQTAFVDIKILPPLWRTWWAYLIYFALGSYALWFVMQYYTSKVQENQKHELDQMKFQFFVNVSHEFRTPLTLILNPVDKILNSTNDPEVVKASAVSIQRSARRLLHLVNQLLDYRKMDVGMSPIQLEKGDIVKFGYDIFSLFKDLASKKDIQYTFTSGSESIKCLFDFDKVEKIITNLLSNAIKFTQNGGEISVTINKIKAQSTKSKFYFFKTQEVVDFIEIVVKDNGVGLNKEQRKHIFSRFYNLDVTKSGTGIGLNFTKALVELHGGEIFVESKRRKGAKFVVRLPLDVKSKSQKVENIKNEFLINSREAVNYDMIISNENDLNTATDAPTELNSEKVPVILIVEDNKELRTHLANDLKGEYIVKQAVNGVAGLEMTKKHFPDIIVSDVMMPKMDGFEMCRQIKTDIETSHIPVILLTARSLEEDRIEGYENGADGYISKPFVTSVLKARINNLLEAKQRLQKRFSEIGGVLPAGDVTTNNLDKAFLDKATRIIIENISDIDFKQEQLLSEMGIGRSQFYRKINSLTGGNPSNFIRTIRLRYAADLLLKKNYSIKEVTHMTGFNSTAYFSKTFRELFEVTPSQFIEENENKRENS